MPWVTIYYCTSCNEELTNRERLYSHGTCPFCGHHTESASVDTRCETVLIEDRLRRPPWGMMVCAAVLICAAWLGISLFVALWQ